jgi:hypothetical protein
VTTNVGVEAARKLAHLGYRFTVNGETIKARYEGPGQPDPAQVRPLLETVKAHKAEVLPFLRCHCLRCGGVVFVGNECFLCDWLPQGQREAQAQELQGEARTCGGCGHFLPSRLNPKQGFGQCVLAHLSKRPGAYPGKTACPHFEATVGDGTLRLAQ